MTNPEQRKEIAMEEGMLHGIDAYNQAMGYEVTDMDDPQNKETSDE